MSRQTGEEPLGEATSEQNRDSVPDLVPDEDYEVYLTGRFHYAVPASTRDPIPRAFVRRDNQSNMSPLEEIRGEPAERALRMGFYKDERVRVYFRPSTGECSSIERFGPLQRSHGF